MEIYEKLMATAIFFGWSGFAIISLYGAADVINRKAMRLGHVLLVLAFVSGLCAIWTWG